MKSGAGIELVDRFPTLAPTQFILAVIQRLQSELRIDDLKLDSLTPKNAKQQVNQRYSEFVVKACQAHFSDLIPNRSDRDNLYTHIFRACYATIAAHWFCPPNIPEHHFKAEIQGHFSLTSDGQKLPNYSARANYDDYAISRANGNRDGRLGIKLLLLPELQVIAAFQPPSLLPQPSMSDAAYNTPMHQDLANFIDKEVLRISQELAHLNHQSAHPDMESQPSTLHPLPTPSDTLPAAAPNQSPAGVTSPATVPIAGKHKRPPLLADDLERMTRLMATHGVSGSSTHLFHQLLDAFEQLQHQQQAQPLPGFEVVH